jgi:hypothetical protein
MGLIDAQLWAEHIIFAPSIAKRGDQYTVKRVQETQKKQRYREKKRLMSTVDSEGTRGQIAVLSTSYTDPYSESDPNSKPEKTKEEDPNRDCSRNQKAPPSKNKLKGSDAIYATLAELDKFEKSWQWYCDRLKSIPPDKDGRKVSPGSKVKAAIAWRDFVEATDSIFVFKKSAPRYDFKQIGVPHFERFIRNGLWQIDLEPVTENDFIGTDERSQSQLNPAVLAALAEFNPNLSPEEAFKHV